MPYDAKWTEHEFKIVLLNPHDTDYELVAKLDGRSQAAIANIRGFIHNFHVKGNISGLDDFMVRLLEQGYWQCPRCYTRVEKYGYPEDKGWVP